MSQNELTAKIRELRELRRMADEIAAEIDGITDQIKNHMDAEKVDTLTGADYKVTYKAVTSSRVDTTALKKGNARNRRTVHQNHHQPPVFTGIIGGKEK